MKDESFMNLTTNTIPTKKPARNSVMELLRILCMLMIIAGHYYAHGVAYAVTPLSPETYSLRILALQLITFGADIANDLFIIITGYFMINSTMKGSRILKLFGTAVFYATAIALVFHFSGLKVLSLNKFFEFMFPFGPGENWYITCYLLLSLLIPYLNIFLKHLDQKQFAALLALIFVIHFIAPLQEAITFWSTSHGLEQFIFLYFVGAYVKLHGFKTKFLQNKWCWRGILVVLIGLWFAVGAGTGIRGLTLQNPDYMMDVTKYFPIFSVLISSTLLVVASGIKPFYSKFINLISGSVLAIYLIHDNALVRSLIWQTVSPNIGHIGSNYMFIHLAKKTIVIFFVCVIIDQCRLWLLEKPIDKLVEKFKK